MLQYFEWYLPADANHWNRAAEDAEYLAKLGITDVWNAIMSNIHEACVKYGTQPDGYINYVKGANIAGFMKVAQAMLEQGII